MKNPHLSKSETPENLLEIATQLLRDLHTKQQQLRQKYNQSQHTEQAKRQILQTLPFTIFQFDLEGKVTYYNQRQLKLLPNLTHHVLGQSVLDIFRHLPSLKEQILEAFNRESFRSFFQYKQCDYSIWYEAIYNGYGKRLKTYMLITEISNPNNTVENLPKIYTEHFNFSKRLAFLYSDEVRNLLKLDKQAQHLLNYPEQSIAFEIFENKFLNGQKLPQKEETTELEIINCGKLRYLRLNQHGKTKESNVWVLEDISPWIHQQNQLQFNLSQQRHILENISEAFFTIDKSWCFSYINSRAESLLRRSRQELLGKNIWDEFADAIGTNFYYNYHKVMEEGVMVEFEEYYPFLESWFWVRASPTPQGIMVLFHNINRHKITEQKLQEINANKDRFFSILAHDLKNPFNNILSLVSAVQTIPEEFSKEELCQMIIELNDIAKNTNQLLENLLIWSKHQMKNYENRPQVLNLLEAIMPEIKLIQTQGRQKDVQVLSEGINPKLKVLADHNLLNTVLRNLLNNALKFTPHKGQIILKAEEQTHKIVLSIEDNGVGMTKTQQQSIFQMEKGFTRQGTEGELGTGLGLKISSELLERIGEHLWCHSEEQKGSIFSFTLPKVN